MVKLFRVGFAFFVALVFAVFPVSFGLVSPAWAVTDWAQVGSDINGEVASESSGRSVSFSSNGSRVAIGVPGNDDGGADAGQVRIYDLTGGNWVQVGNDINGEAAGDSSGVVVALSSNGSRVAIGARDNDGAGDLAGHVRIYDLTGGNWVQVGSDIDGVAAGDGFGASVSLSSDGSRVAIGSPSSDIGGDFSGQVRVFDLTGGNWVQVGGAINGAAAYDNFGGSVSLSSDGSRIAIGAQYKSAGGGSFSGQVRMFDLSGGAWVQVGSGIDGEAQFDFSSGSVSLSSDGSRVAIGAPGNDGFASGAGHVRVYDWTGGAWVQVGSDIDGEASNDESGSRVSLSSDGSRVAIGSPANDGAGDLAGQVRVFDLTGGNWVQAGSDIDGEAAGDAFGGSVSLSSDGTRVAIGAAGNDGAAVGAGHVRIFSFPVPGGSGGGGGTPSEELADTGGVDASGIAFGGAIALVVGIGGYLLRRRGARA